jgi:hypothetical protein
VGPRTGMDDVEKRKFLILPGNNGNKATNIYIIRNKTYVGMVTSKE